MQVSQAVASRKSVRGFLPRAVAPDTIRRVLDAAARAPSGGNLQPWHIHVVGGEALQRLLGVMRERIAQAPAGEAREYDIYPRELVSPYRERRFQVGEALYHHLGIPREDKARRLAQFASNFTFFGAPLALFCTVDRRMGPPQWSDLGMYLQTVMLLLREEGLDSCAQECWAMYPQTVADFLALPAERMLFSGMAIGYEDPAAPANQLRAERAPLAEFTEFMGI
ncbi:nitroreductase [Cupriavidus necator]|uniref:nitroreductase n=1 Tax=Cupriavidus necator TaxID=106590 RepID=UPI00149070FF|nr:nitroreductase [Cupriavidus necator]NOV27876.1 nitroreductase [Cupriavidus necator]